MPLSVGTGSFLRLVHPFAYGATYEDLLEVVDTGEVWRDLNETRQYLMPHLRSRINQSRADGQGPPRSELLRILTSEPRRFPVHGPCMLKAPRDTDVQFSFAGAGLAVFRSGIGVLWLDVDLPGLPVPHAQAAVHYLRFFAATAVPSRERPIQAPHGRMLGMSRVLKELLAFADPRPLATPGQLLAHVGLFIDGDADPEESFIERYRFRRFFHHDMVVTADRHHPDDLRPRSVSYGRDQSFFFSLDGGGYIGVNVPTNQFFRETMPSHLKREYFMAYLLALHQRYLFAEQSTRLADIWMRASDDEARIAAFVAAKEELLSRTTRSLFVQVMQAQNYHATYREWVDVLEIDRFRSELLREANDMHDYVIATAERRRAKERERDEKRQQRIERLVAFAGLIFALPSIALAFLGVSLRNVTADETGLDLWVVVLITLIAAAFGAAAAAFALAIGARKR